MRLAIIAIDTRGGVQPYLALALGFRKAGHEVRLLAPEGFEALARPTGLDFRPLSGDVEAAVRAAAEVAERGPLATMRYARDQVSVQVKAWLAEAYAATEGVDVISGGIGGMTVGASVAEKRGVPFVEAHLQPIGEPTSEFPGVLVPGVPAWLGAFGRRLSHRATAFGLGLQASVGLGRARVEVLGLPEKPRPPRAGLPVLYGISRHVIPKPADWSPSRHVVGYWTLPAAPGWTPPPALEQFLAAGPKPVCIGFGSMASEDPKAMSALVLEAVRRAGVRAVLLSGWGGLADAARDDVLTLTEVPHEWLFPRVAGVVHHGGAGTTGAGFRAGVPALVVPFTMDQPFWGGRVHALGAGPRPIPRKRLSVAALAEGLRALTSDETQRARAAEVGALVRAEDGVAAAVEHFTRL